MKEVTLELPTVPDEALVLGAVVVYMTKVSDDGPERVNVAVEASFVLTAASRDTVPEVRAAILRAAARAVRAANVQACAS